MKIIGTYMKFFILVSLSIPGLVLADNSMTKGQEIAQKVYDRPDGDTTVQSVTMTLVPKKGTERVRNVIVIRKESPGQIVRSLVRFLSPKDIENSALSTTDKAGENVHQFMYLPALKRVTRISSSRKGGRFVGSEFYYEDLRDRTVDKDIHTFKGETKLEGNNVLVVESVPKVKSSSVYAKKVVYVHPQTWLPVKVEFYEGRLDKPTKQLLAKKIERISGIWTVMNSVMENLKTGDKTVLQVNKVIYGAQIPDYLFESLTLEDPSRDQNFLKKLKGW